MEGSTPEPGGEALGQGVGKEGKERGLTALATRRPVGVAMVALSVVVFGLISLLRLPRNLMPDISYPTITVRTEYPGAAPIDVETRVSRRLEEVVSQVRNLRRVTSISRAEVSDVILEFTWATDMSLATSDVREKAAQAQLPDEASKPTILRYDPTLDPILQIGLYREPVRGAALRPVGGAVVGIEDTDGASRLDAEEANLIGLRLLAEDLVERELEGVTGVAGVKVRGGLEREIRIEVDEKLLRAKGVSLALVNQRLKEENLNQASGILYEGDQSRVVRTVNEFVDVEEIRDTILRQDDPINKVRLRDVATVTFGYTEPDVMTRINGNPCVKIDIYKEADANLVEVSSLVREKIYGTSAEHKMLAEILERQRREAVRLAAGERKDSGTKAQQPADKKGRKKGSPSPAAGGDPERPRFITSLLPGGFDPEDPFHERDREQGRYRVTVMSDQSVFIEKALDDVLWTVILGGALAILVLYAFLRNAWFTLTVGLSIPLSVVATFIAMHLFGVSLNMMSLGGLALGIGMLVDSSIVVLESIFRTRQDNVPEASPSGGSLFGRHGGVQAPSERHGGTDTARLAAVRGTGYVASAVTASTFTTVAVFFPIVFVEGVAGQIFRDQALAVVISLIASLITALYFIPAFVCRRPGGHGGAERRDASRPCGASRLLVYQSRFPFMRAFARELESHSWRGWRALLLVAGVPVEIVCLLLRLVLGLLGLVVFALCVACVTGFRHVAPRMFGLWNDLTRRPFAAFDHAFDGCRRGYLWALEGALGHRGAVLAVVAVAAFLAFRMLVNLESELIPEVHQGEFSVDIRLPRATRIERTDEIIRPWEARLKNDPALAGIASLTTTVGVDKDDFNAGEEGPHTAKLLVRLERRGDPLVLEEQSKAGIRRLLQDAEFDSVEFRNPVLFSFKTPIEVEVKGYDLTRLRRIVDALKTQMDEIPEIEDVTSNLVRGYPEVQVRLDREMLSRHKLTMGQVGNVIRRMVLGEVPTYFTVGDRKVPMRVRLQEEHRYSVEDLKNLVVNPGSPVEIRLADVVVLDGDAVLLPQHLLPLSEGPSEIRRIDHQRAAVVTANLAGMSLGSATEKVAEAIRSLDYPPEFSVGFGGQKEEMDLALTSLRRALLLAIFLVFVVMAMLFESLVQPFVIIFAVPLAMVGVIPVLSVLGIPLSIVVFLGMIVLAGIVVNNAIVLVDTANRLRRGGATVRESLVRAGELRLRPILMTTATTVLGLLPLTGLLGGILGTGDGVEIRGPLAITVIAGLISSTILTLIVIPVMFSVVQSGLARIGGGPRAAEVSRE